MAYSTSIDYEALLQSALKQMMGTVLKTVGKEGLPGDHHFYIGFDTQHVAVEISDRLKKDYPEEMVIVLRHQFENLFVAKTHFGVDLFFGGIRESLKVPFEAVTRFEDPSANFALQFTQNGEEYLDSDDDLNSLEDELISDDYEGQEVGSITKFPGTDASPELTSKANPAKANNESVENKVVSLDHFRKS